jgi:hypothetical protein
MSPKHPAPPRRSPLLLSLLTLLATIAAIAVGSAQAAPAPSVLGLESGVGRSVPLTSAGVRPQPLRPLITRRVAAFAYDRIAVATGVAAKAVATLSDDVARTFKGGEYATRTLDEDLVLRRYYDGSSSRQIGSYWTRTTYSSPGRAKQYLALPTANTAEKMVTIRVPAGTTIYEGKAAGAFGRRGGGNQVYIPRVDPTWIAP